MSTRSRLAALCALAVLVLVAACAAVEEELDRMVEETGAAGGSGAGEEMGQYLPFSVEVDAAALTEAIEALEVAEEADEGYDRSLFAHWRDADGNGCDARDDTLVAEDRSGRLTEASCGESMTGQWVSMYDGETVTESGDLDIDHFVPLKEAWGSGAHAWTAERRQDYANSLAAPWHLVAVTASSNRSKSDQDPAEWMPTLEAVWCPYVWAWVEVKREWGLTVDPEERAALLGYAAEC
ncbi:HNH endonuclease family protein [Glycomyces halotolerans]